MPSETHEERREGGWELGKVGVQLVIRFLFPSHCTLSSHFFHPLWSELSVFHLGIVFFKFIYFLGKVGPSST